MNIIDVLSDVMLISVVSYVAYLALRNEISFRLNKRLMTLHEWVEDYSGYSKVFEIWAGINVLYIAALVVTKLI